MRIAIGSDHAGFALKEKIKAFLLAEKFDVVDYGTHSPESVDYPDIAAQVANAIKTNEAEQGILLCKTGIGMSIVANKFSGIRAALCRSMPNWPKHTTMPIFWCSPANLRQKTWP